MSKKYRVSLSVDEEHVKRFDLTFDAEDEQAGRPRRSEQEWRQKLGKYGVTGELQKRKMGTFSDGQKARVVMANLTLQNPF